MKDTKYDAIVIGSGMGGLTTASLLAQVGKKRVLVLERHFKLGGFTHSFRRKKYEWDVGVHYVGQMQPGCLTRRIMDLVTRHGVEWYRMKSPYERFDFPQGSFDVPDGMKEFQSQLIERFPDERQALEQYFRDVRRAQTWVIRWFFSKMYSSPVANALNHFGKRLAGMTTQEYMDRFQNPLLKAILTAQWPDFGSPPQESAFGFHSTVSADFFDGGFYPVGGSKEIANHATEAIESAGGKCLVNHEVQSIVVQNGVARGVVAKHKGKEIEFQSPVIISNAGAWNTFQRFVPAEHCQVEREQTKRIKPGVSANILFLGLNADPRTLGFDECNYWIYSRLDHDVQARYRDGEPDRVDGCFVSFGSLRNPEQTTHTAQLISFCHESDWSEFANSNWMKRGEAYEQRKAKIAEAMLSYAEQRMPGIRGMVDYQELSTPLTVKSFTAHAGGAVYGQACDANRLFRDHWQIGTSLKNLYLTGSDVGTPGVNGAMMAGVMTAAKILGPLGMTRIMWRAYSANKKSDSNH